MNLVNNIFFGLGLCSIILGIPLSQILANSYNFFTINNYFIEISISLMFIIISLKFFYEKIKIKSKLLLTFFNIIFFQIINIYVIKYTEYFFNSYSTSIKIITYSSLILFFFVISIVINKKILESIIKYLSILFFFQFTLIIFYSLNFDTNRHKNDIKKISDTKNVFLIILDELSLDFITNKNNEIKDEFINLKKLTNNSSFFTNAHTSFDFTSKAMLSVLTFGDSLDNELIKNKSHYFKDVTLYDDNLYKELSKTHRINLFASYDYCHYHIRFISYCISKVNNEKNLIKSIQSYIYFIYLYSTPKFIINRLHSRNIINKDGTTRDYYINEINLIDQFINNIKLNTDERNLYLLHTNITHQPWVLDKDGRINLEKVIVEEDKIKNINELKNSYNDSILYADKKLGEIFSFLKNKNIYDDALIIIMSDHGVSFDENIFLRMNGNANTQISKVPLIIKKPFQRKARVIKEYANIIDVGSTLVNFLNNKKKKFNHSKDLFNYASFGEMNIPFLSIVEEYDITGKIIYNKKIYCKNSKEQYVLMNNENYNNIYNICINK